MLRLKACEVTKFLQSINTDLQLHVTFRLSGEQYVESFMVQDSIVKQLLLSRASPNGAKFWEARLH